MMCLVVLKGRNEMNN